MVNALINELDFTIKLRKDFNATEFLHKKEDFEFIYEGFNRAIDVIRCWQTEYPNLLAPLRVAFKTDISLGAVPDGENEFKLYEQGYNECVGETELFIEKNERPIHIREEQ